ncbi:hypothetical protein [Bradyrhizobium sp. SEMIA]|nr:hypothetical protein [Bradyrhizobium sp. SEMIA]QOG22224.1 hypothetical protein FOM02_37950 [Bradyrhizobium sp. SEMIA]
MTISMLDQKMFKLACGHEVVLGRLSNIDRWVCETCGRPTALTSDPFKSLPLKELDTAQQIDLQAKERGEEVIRLT